MKKIHIDGGLFSISGYSTAGRGFAEALDRRDDVEVTVRDIIIKGDQPMVEPHPLKEKQAPPTSDTDIVLMWGVPELRSMVYNRFPIPEGVEIHHMLSWECDDLPKIWKTILNDEVNRVITPSNFSSISFKGVNKRLHVVPHGYDPKVFFKKEDIKKDNTFRILFTGTWNRRKAPMETIISMILGLIDTDSEIMIKLNYDQASIINIYTSIQAQLVKVRGVTADRLPKIRIFNGVYTQDQMNDLYNIADVVVLTSRGEAWGLPLMNAMATKTPIITTNIGGQMDFVPADYKYLIPVLGTELCQGDGFYAPQFGLQWHVPDFTLLQDQVRQLFDLNGEERDAIGEELFNHMKHLTWDNVVDNYLNQVSQPLYDVKVKERVTKPNS